MRIFSIFGRGLSIGSSALVFVAMSMLSPSAQAVPSYARQTGAECAACHVAGFGPQLTPYGIKFKIGGYTDSDGAAGKVPLSAMLTAGLSHTAKGMTDADKATDSAKSNNNLGIQETSLFLAGRLMDNVGAFTQVTYSGVDKKTSLDQADLRYARTLNVGDKELAFGLSLNTNPTLTDPFNTLGQWRFPYIQSDFGAGFGKASPIVENLGGGVAGLNAYGLFDNHVYAELGAYNKLSHDAQRTFNSDPVVSKFNGVGSYGRLAYFVDRKRDNFSVGLLGFSANVVPVEPVSDPSQTDKYRDIGIDASYQYLGNRQHIFTANASYLRETQRLDNTSPGDRLTINQARLATSYHYNNTWGGTLGLFDTHGTANSAIYGAGPGSYGSISGSPNTRGYMLQADWTPWGKADSWAAPWANARVGVQYTGYNRFMGGSTYTDGDGNERRARDNNTTMLFLWLSI